MQSNCPFPAGGLVAGYLRDSGGEEQEQSVHQQESALRAYCKDHGLALTRIYTDAASPGSSAAKRDAFQEMIHHFRNGATEQGVIVWKFSRFARNIDDAQFFRADLRRRGFILHSLMDNIPSGAEGRLFEAAIDWMNDRFLADMSSDIKRGLLYTVEKHGAIPGIAPVGLMRAPIETDNHRDGRPRNLHRWVINPQTAPLVRQAFILRGAGATGREVIQATNICKHASTLHSIYTNHIYYGELHFGGLVIPEYVPAIVTVQEWKAAQPKRHTKPNPAEARRAGSSFLLSGIAYCPNCGGKLSGRICVGYKRARQAYYICDQRYKDYVCDARHLPKHFAEQMVIDQVIKTVLTPEELARAQKRELSIWKQVSAEKTANVPKLKGEVGEQQKIINNLVGAITRIGDSPSLLTALREAEGALADALHRLKQTELDIKPKLYSVPELEELSASLIASLKDEALQRHTLRTLVRRVEISRVDNALVGTLEVISPFACLRDSNSKGTHTVGMQTTITRKPTAKKSPKNTS